MEKVTTILLVFLMSAGISYGQGTEIGILAGGNFSTFSGDTNELGNQVVGQQGSSDFSRRFGGRIGGFLRFEVTDGFAVRPEVTYSQKGTRYEGSSSTVLNGQSVTFEFDVVSRYDYLDIPVLGEYTFQNTSAVSPYVFAGPSVGFSVSSESEVNATARSGGQSNSETQTEDEDIESTDFGAVIGGGISYSVGSGNSLLLDVRFNPSFTSLDPDTDLDTQNQAITVNVGYSFSL